MPELQFVYGEHAAATASGLPPRQFIKKRVKFLTQGADWDIVDQQVAYSETGLLKVLEKLTGQKNLSVTGVYDRAKKIAGKPATTAPPIIGTVTKVYPNPHLIQVSLEGGALAHVRVKSSKNFRRGMECPLEGTDIKDLYNLARRLPRFAGRW